MFDFSLLQFLPEKERERIGDQALDIVFARALERADALITDDARKEYNAIFTKEHSDEGIAEFFAKHIPQFPNMLMEEVFRLRKEISDSTETQKP